ncbi:MAG: glutamate synthase-related protein [Nitrososphaerota archaeon]|nr:glutamate synthase-related protein [Candidatus Bathyarchaeota archaeon]MDW8062135.1 glutamate synthase-related protein [Nitrososphaerota archaeon]
MNSSYLNSKSTTWTTLRVRDPAASSGMCPLCIEDCPFLCQIALSALRGREALYPAPFLFGLSTAGAVKDYGLDWGHFNFHCEVRGAEGIEPDPDKALFPNVDVTTIAGGIKLRIPVITGALGSTAVAAKYWRSIAIGAALSGIIVTVGENVVGMDPDAIISGGKVVESPALKSRVEAYREFWDGVYGGIAVQTNVEDERLGVDIYALTKLEVDVIERKWGQGAKAIGGEVRISDLDRAIMLKRRGYLVIPDPEDPEVRAAFKMGAIRSFERHSRVGMASREDFLEGIDRLREHGAKHISLKTGAYRPTATAYTLKVASEAKIDYVTFDGCEGGTGMSPVPMMDEMGIPTVYLEAQVLKCLQILGSKGRYIPDIVMAGGFIDETQILKAIAMSNFGDQPYVKAIVIGRAMLTAAMKAEHFVELARKNELPKSFVNIYGDDPEKFFASLPELRAKLGDKVYSIPWGSIGLYSYLEKIRIGLQQLLAGMRKFKLNLASRNDLFALTERAAKATGIPLPEESDIDAIESILLDD